MRPINLLLVSVLGISLVACKAPEKSTVKDEFDAKPEQELCVVPKKNDYPSIFCVTRNLLVNEKIQDFFRKQYKSTLVIPTAQAAFYRENYGVSISTRKAISETQMVYLFLNNPVVYTELDDLVRLINENKGKRKDQAIADKFIEKFKKQLASTDKIAAYSDPFEPLELPADSLSAAPKHSPGYSNLELYVTHKFRNAKGKLVSPPAGGLKSIWINQIKKAQKEIVLNVFDFDLKEVAKALVERAKNGVRVRVGIDGNTISARPEVQEVYEFLEAHGVSTFDVESVALNHQKMMAADWSIPGKGLVIFSSGNLTQSCIGEEGDLVKQSESVRSKSNSIPNANHMVTFDSNVVASLINNELTKTFEMALRGKSDDRDNSNPSYPLSGVFKIWGPEPLKGQEQPFILVAFSPGGGLGSMNATFLTKLIEASKPEDGAYRMAQFAFSSKTVTKSLMRVASKLAKEGKPFDFKIVGDRPFAMREWSQFLSMSSLKRDDDGEFISFKSLSSSPWKTLFEENRLNYDRFKNNILVAPDQYGEKYVKIAGKSLKVNAKIHHKLFVGGALSTLGTSFNFSDNAEINNEQMIAFYDRDLADSARAIVDSLADDIESKSKSTHSVNVEADLRNSKHESLDEIDEPQDDPVGPGQAGRPGHHRPPGSDNGPVFFEDGFEP